MVTERTRDRRVQRTRRLLHQALMSCILEKKYESITVQDILDRADVGRSTFYTHFRDKDELLISGLQHLKGLLQAAHATSVAPPDKSYEKIISFSRAMFEHAYEHRELHRALVGSGAQIVVRRLLHSFLSAAVSQEIKTALQTGWFAKTYDYDEAGNITSLANPMGFTLTQQMDAAGRLSSITSSWSGTQHPGTLASGFQYHPHGAVQKVLLGNGLTETMAFNNRLQPCRINVNESGTMFQDCTAQAPTGNKLYFAYSFTDAQGQNNGNVMSWSASGAQAFSRTYTYDELNRLKTMGWPVCNYTWNYDIWGNRIAQDATSGTGQCGEHFPTTLTNNRISELSYDAAGILVDKIGCRAAHSKRLFVLRQHRAAKVHIAS